MLEDLVQERQARLLDVINQTLPYQDIRRIAQTFGFVLKLVGDVETGGLHVQEGGSVLAKSLECVGLWTCIPQFYDHVPFVFHIDTRGLYFLFSPGRNGQSRISITKTASSELGAALLQADIAQHVYRIVWNEPDKMALFLFGLGWRISGWNEADSTGLILLAISDASTVYGISYFYKYQSTEAFSYVGVTPCEFSRDAMNALHALSERVPA